MCRFFVGRIILFVTLLLVLPCSAFAQPLGADQFGSASAAEVEALLSRLTPLVSPEAREEKSAPHPAPGMTIGTPTAYGAGWRQGFVGLSGIAYFDNGANGTDVDGSMSFGAGLGDAVKTVGFETSINIISLTNEFADSGSVGIKLHKIVPGTNGLGVALGWSNALNWGDAKKAEDTVYLVASKKISLRPGKAEPYFLSISLGAGTGTFRTVDDITADENDLNLFGSAGVQLLQQLSFVTSWTGSQLNVGFGVAPFSAPLTATIGVSDVTEEKGLGAAFIMNIGYSFSF